MTERHKLPQSFACLLRGLSRGLSGSELGTEGGCFGSGEGEFRGRDDWFGRGEGSRRKG
jgi:hypothetical protein